MHKKTIVSCALIVFIIMALWFIVKLSNELYSFYKETEKLNGDKTFLTNRFFERKSPANWIREDQILVYPDRIIILIPNASISSYVDTNSMDPLIDENSNGIRIKPNSPKDIHVGDIITFKKGDSLIAHRVIKIGQDEEGWYCITKGDNALNNDGKIRFKDIKFITIGILY